MNDVQEEIKKKKERWNLVTRKVAAQNFEARAWKIVCCEIDGADVELLERKISADQTE
jgi:hypothetical protein